MTEQHTDLLLFHLIPKFEEGSSNEGVFLTSEECDQIIQVLRLSVSIESAVFNVTDLIKQSHLNRFAAKKKRKNV